MNQDKLSENISGSSVRKILLIVIACIAAVCILFGALRGEISEVYNKAVVVCLECIGLGR